MAGAGSFFTRFRRLVEKIPRMGLKLDSSAVHVHTHRQWPSPGLSWNLPEPASRRRQSTRLFHGSLWLGIEGRVPEESAWEFSTEASASQVFGLGRDCPPRCCVKHLGAVKPGTPVILWLAAQ